MKYVITGESAITIVVGDTISDKIHGAVASLNALIKSQNIPGIVETVPTYASLTIHYLPHIVSFEALVEKITAVQAMSMDGVQEYVSTVFEIPVAYGGSFGLDIDFVASHCNLPVNRLIDLHSSPQYLIYMLGFTPGFPYLGGMDETLATPRLTVPRTRIEPGSVGIAGKQTGVYSVASPGGWQLIGRTPIRLYDPQFEPHILLSAGNFVKFTPIDHGDFDRISQLALTGGYKCKTYQRAVKI